jgi:hypothetical protein
MLKRDMFEFQVVFTTNHCDQYNQLTDSCMVLYHPNQCLKRTEVSQHDIMICNFATFNCSDQARSWVSAAENRLC